MHEQEPGRPGARRAHGVRDQSAPPAAPTAEALAREFMGPAHAEIAVKLLRKQDNLPKFPQHPQRISKDFQIFPSRNPNLSKFSFALPKKPKRRPAPPGYFRIFSVTRDIFGDFVISVT